MVKLNKNRSENFLAFVSMSARSGSRPMPSIVVIIMFGPFGPNMVIFVWIWTLLLFYVEAYFYLSFYPIDFKPRHTDPEVLGRCAMTFLSHTS